ncbi:MAG: hypothetical protein K2N42_01405, partial [Anaeroplasmataceae bacterium]|nr:hypothetical protein [Anaeroplasmataceae bacterium]
ADAIQYTFYYTYLNDSEFLYSISIHYGYVGSTFSHVYDASGKELFDSKKKNVLHISFGKIPIHTEQKMLDGSLDIYHIYLCDEDQVERIEINQNNFMEYFSWKHYRLFSNGIDIAFHMEKDFHYYKSRFHLNCKINIDGIIFEKEYYYFQYHYLEIDEVKEVNTIELEVLSVEGVIYRMLV